MTAIEKLVGNLQFARDHTLEIIKKLEDEIHRSNKESDSYARKKGQLKVNRELLNDYNKQLEVIYQLQTARETAAGAWEAYDASKNYEEASYLIWTKRGFVLAASYFGKKSKLWDDVMDDKYESYKHEIGIYCKKEDDYFVPHGFYENKNNEVGEFLPPDEIMRVAKVNHSYIFKSEFGAQPAYEKVN
jgi:hypothetical protein